MTFLELHRERDFQELFLETVRTMPEQEIYELLRDMARERLRECDRLIERTNRIIGRDFQQKWAA